MEPLRRHIEQELGVKAVSIGYSTRPTLAGLAQTVADEVQQQVGRGGRAFAVTHSMGGIVLRHIMDLPDTGGVHWVGCCMLAPPNHGSHVARYFNNGLHMVSGVFRLATGPAGAELAEEIAACAKWPVPPQPCGIIAGTRSLALVNPTSWMTAALRLHGGRESDGTVAVDETITEAMTDFCTVDADHTLIMRYKHVKELVVAFIRDGSFGAASCKSDIDKYRQQQLEVGSNSSSSR